MSVLGIVLTKTAAVFQTGSSINGCLLAQTAVTLDAVTVTCYTTVTPQAPITPAVFLGTSGNYAILSKAGISTVPPSNDIMGDIAVSPIAATSMTGFSLTLDSTTRKFATSTQVTSKAYGASYGSNLEAPRNL